MAKTEREQAVPPSDCEIGSLVKDIIRGKIGVVMGRYGEDRVQLRPVNGGKEWDAFTVRPLSAREELNARPAARNERTRQGL